MGNIHLVREFAIPAERVYAGLADQDGMGRWMGAKISVPTRGPGGLVGTVRRIHVGPSHFDERIVAAEPDRSIDYQICSPLPGLRHHLGQIRVAPVTSTTCRVTWTVTMAFSPAFMGPFVLGGVRVALSRGLAKLDRQLARA